MEGEPKARNAPPKRMSASVVNAIVPITPPTSLASLNYAARLSHLPLGPVIQPQVVN
jgi:hypothetical protein